MGNKEISRNKWQWKHNSKLLGCSKSSSKRKFIAIQSYLKKQEKRQIGYLILHLKQLEKEEQRKIHRRKGKSLSHIWLFVTPWTVAYQAPPSMGFSRQEHWSGLPFPSPLGSIEEHWILPWDVWQKGQGQLPKMMPLSWGDFTWPDLFIYHSTIAGRVAILLPLKHWNNPSPFFNKARP